MAHYWLDFKTAFLHLQTLRRNLRCDFTFTPMYSFCHHYSNVHVHLKFKKVVEFSCYIQRNSDTRYLFCVMSPNGIISSISDFCQRLLFWSTRFAPVVSGISIVSLFSASGMFVTFCCDDEVYATHVKRQDYHVRPACYNGRCLWEVHREKVNLSENILYSVFFSVRVSTICENSITFLKHYIMYLICLQGETGTSS